MAKKEVVKKPVKKAVKKTGKLTKSVAKNQAIKSTKVNTKAIKVEKKTGLSKLLPMILVIVVVIAIAVGVALFSTRPRIINLENVNTIEEMNDALKFKIKKPEDVSTVTYSIENDTVGRVEYKKNTMSGGEMTFVMKASSSLEENLTGLENDWGIPILMTVICNDGSDIEVTSYVAVDDNQVMKGEWYDNDLYYSMTTDCLTSREDFLQEVNRVIINNHVEF